MKRVTIVVGLILLFTELSFAQKKIKNLEIFANEAFNAKASITVGSLDNDRALTVFSLKNALVMNGFKVISEATAQQSVNINNNINKNSSSSSQNISITAQNQVNSIYYVTMSYKSTAEEPPLIYELSGQIVDLANNGEIVATFQFSQSYIWGGVKTKDLMMDIAKRLKGNISK